MDEDKYEISNILDILEILFVDEKDEHYNEGNQWIEWCVNWLENPTKEGFKENIGNLKKFEKKMVNLYMKNNKLKHAFIEGSEKIESHKKKTLEKETIIEAQKNLKNKLKGETIKIKEDKTIIIFKDYISSGSYGSVFKCNVKSDTISENTEYAAKVVLYEKGEDAILKNHEVKMQQLVDSEYVMKILYFANCSNFASSYDAFIIIMDLMDGELGSMKINSADIARRYSLQISRGLYDIHRSGIIHRDLKGGNILYVMKEDKIKLKISDFGASCLQKNLKRSGNHTTPSYTSPEQLKYGRISFTHDVWSIGCVFYKLYRGNTLFNLTNNDDPNYKFDEVLLSKFEEFFDKNMMVDAKDEEMTMILDKIFVREPIKRITLYEIISILSNKKI
jgi:serine/threonine protein kinase